VISDDHISTAGPAVDTSTPTSSRVWDQLLGGKDNFAADRAVAAAVRDVAPDFSMVAIDNQQFLIRAGAYLAGELGITQYLDCGAGLPTTNPLHTVVQAVVPGAKVVYVDNDPVVLTHARALLATNEDTQVISGDIFDPAALLQDDTVKTFLDWSQPVAIIHTATLHHHPGELAELTKVMQTYVEAAAVGSCTVISHFVDPGEAGASRFAHDIEKILLDGLGTGWFRSLDQIHALFPNQELLAPGIVTCRQWPDDETEIDSVARDLIVGGVARKRTDRA
jgi:hypothetical protein